MKEFLSEFGAALRRVSSEYRDAATWKGEAPAVVRVDLWGLEREESDRLYYRFTKNDNIEPVSEIRRSDEFLAQKRSYLIVQAVNVANVTAATTLVFDAVRRALHDEDLIHKVTHVRVESTPGVAPEFEKKPSDYPYEV